MQVETLGHATLLLEDGEGRPLIATDPWLTGSTYWRSWWIENYPGPEELARLRASRWLYITHEHPDHYHPPSLRLLREGLAEGQGPEVLLPDFLRMGMEGHLREMGFRTRRLAAGQWESLAPELRVLSLPQWNNDSILLLDTPAALLVNLNDAKPSDRALSRLAALRRALGKRCVVLRSYSPASPMNSYLRDGVRVERGGKRGYARAAAKACHAIGADDFLPFASQVVFRRPDSDWANDFKVRQGDLRRHWEGPARLHRPYCRLQLESAAAEYRNPAQFDPHLNDHTAALVAEQLRLNRRAELERADEERLQAQLRELRLFLRLLLPRGFGIRADGRSLFWNSRRGRIERRAPRPGEGHFVLELPLLPLKEAAAYGHLGDLCIPMFTTIHLDDRTPPRRVDVFFMLLILRDYGYLGSFGRLRRWSGWLLRQARDLYRPLPLPSPASDGAAQAEPFTPEVVPAGDAERAPGR